MSNITEKRRDCVCGHLFVAPTYLFEKDILLCPPRQQVSFILIRYIAFTRDAPLLPGDLPHIRVALVPGHHGAGQCELCVFVRLDQQCARYLEHPWIVTRSLHGNGEDECCERRAMGCEGVRICVCGMGCDWREERSDGVWLIG